jgi:hypoxanthine phosphoribosyltransferase
MGEGTWYDGDIDRVVITQEQIRQRTTELAQQIAEDYAQVESILLVCILRGAVMFMADFSRAIGCVGVPVELETRRS